MAIVASSGSSPITTNSSTAAVEVAAKQVYFIQVSGTFNGCTVTIEASANNSTFTSVGTSGVLTSAGWVRVELPIKAAVRLTVSGAGGSTSIAWSINE
jgi:hypothetical protein